MLGSKKNENTCLVCNGTGLRSKKIKKAYLNPVDLCPNCGGVGGIRSNEGISKSKGLSKKAVVGLSVLGALSVGAVAFFLTRKKDEATQPEATQPEATQPEGTTPESTQPEGATPEATTPEATTPFKPSVKISPLGLEMLLLPPGSFKMGGMDDVTVERVEKIEKAFLLDKTVVTQELYQSVMGKNPSYFKGDQFLPVERVNWFDCISFCNELSKLEGLEQCYSKLPSGEWSCDFGKNGYRLPTEKEWEYAAKAGTDNAWAGTNDKKKLEQYAWYHWNSGEKTHPVGAKLPNEWGFYDMSGNVYEWCWDLWDPEDTEKRVVRGGSFRIGDVDFLRVAYRGRDKADWQLNDLGFRLCRTSV